MSTLSLDFTQLIDVAFSIVNSLWPLFVVPIGFMFGFALVSWIISEIRTSLPRG